MYYTIKEGPKTNLGSSNLFAFKGDVCEGALITDDGDQHEFYRVHESLGTLIQQMKNPPNPFFIGNWSEAFENPELIPEGTNSIFIDNSWTI